MIESSHSEDRANPSTVLPPVAPALVSRNPAAWLAIFGPGAVIASLTIGTGELIFSSRGGAIFGYQLLWFFSIVCLLKWVLVFASARHIVLSGAHPFQRWMELPGPRGWLPIVFFLLALVCFPIWVCFHAGTIGTLLAGLTGTQDMAYGGGHFVWGSVILFAVVILALTGGYARLERIQMILVVTMLLAVLVSLFLLKPDWWALLKGFIPQSLTYPDWISTHPQFTERPVWVEIITYVGVVGGSGYDYLAYTSYLRDKKWGHAGMNVLDRASLDGFSEDRARNLRLWIRAPLIDCTLSFVAVLLFSAVFVACGAVILGPQHNVPSGTALLTLQSEFVSTSFPWLRWVYFLGAFLAMFGTLYGTIEVSPTVVREMCLLWDSGKSFRDKRLVRVVTIAWVGGGAMIVLGLSLGYCILTKGSDPPGLVAILTPANLFTGVLACGIICLLNPWADRTFLPKAFRMHPVLVALNLIAGGAFLALGFKAYWDNSGWFSITILLGTVAVGWIAAMVINLIRNRG